MQDDVPSVSSLAPHKKHETSDERRAAIVRRGAERENRDLFAPREPDLGRVETVIPPPLSVMPPSSVGARNENSVLFRVDQLRGAPAPSGQRTSSRSSIASAKPPSFESNDDEGVIDLKALSTAPKSRAPVAPLFSEPPPVTLEVDSRATIPAKQRSKGPLLAMIGGGITAVIAAGFLVSVMFKGEEPVKHTAAVAPPPPAVVAPPPAATPAPETTPPPAETASADDGKAKKKKGVGKKGVASKAPVSSKPAAPKAADPCGCHGDFSCILACTAKGGK